MQRLFSLLPMRATLCTCALLWTMTRTLTCNVAAVFFAPHTNDVVHGVDITRSAVDSVLARLITPPAYDASGLPSLCVVSAYSVPPPVLSLQAPRLPHAPFFHGHQRGARCRPGRRAFWISPQDPPENRCGPLNHVVWGDTCEPTISRRRRLGFRIFGCAEGRHLHIGNPTEPPTYDLVRRMVRDDLCLEATVSVKSNSLPVWPTSRMTQKTPRAREGPLRGGLPSTGGGGHRH